jgi:hypothetical protein
MSRQFEAKQEALKAYPDDREAGVRLLLDYCQVSESDFIYEEGRTPEEYIYGTRHNSPSTKHRPPDQGGE